MKEYWFEIPPSNLNETSDQFHFSAEDSLAMLRIIKILRPTNWQEAMFLGYGVKKSKHQKHMDELYKIQQKRIKEGRKVCAINKNWGLTQCAWPTCGCPSDVQEKISNAKTRTKKKPNKQ